MNDISEMFMSIGEPYGAGMFEEPDKSAFARYSRALRRYFENCPPHAYAGGRLFPAGPKYSAPYCVVPEYSFTVSLDAARLAEKSPDALRHVRSELEKWRGLDSPHTVGGNLYTHSIPNFGRVAREGLDSYEQRITALPLGDFRSGLLDVVAGIRDFHRRSVEYLRSQNADVELIRALGTVPFKPARTLYEAIVCWNFVYYMDMCDNPGLINADLTPFYNGEDVTDVLREFYKNVDCNSGWSAALGPDYNPLTVQCIDAATGLRRPSLELRVTEDMPDEVWYAAARTLQSGSGQPAFYNESAYQTALREKFPTAGREDLLRFNGGGCTETMLAGISNVGSLDAGINLALIFCEVMNSELCAAYDYDDFYARFISKARETTHNVLDMVCESQKSRAIHRPQPMRSLLIDDCIDKNTDFNAGGARYSWSVVNVAGLINVIDSLSAIRELIFRRKKYAPEEFLRLLNAEDAGFFSELRRCPHFGTDNQVADSIASVVSHDVWSIFDGKKPWLGRAFLPSSIQFVTYTAAGEPVGATPDGRRSGEPLCDSTGAIHGNDTEGPTAMLSSVSKLHLQEAVGTPVTNLKLRREHIGQVLKPLVLGFFRQGGMQLQVTCVSKQDMLDAQKHPEKHENLIVRIGGYAEYFNRLSPELQQTVIDRTEF